MRVILLPIKNPSNAKQRLSSKLSPTERKDIVWAMIEDVTRALARATLADRIVVTTQDRSVIQYALNQRWEVIEETEQISESCSVDMASVLLKRQGATAVLRLPMDIPLVKSEDIDQVLGLQLSSSSGLLVPSLDGTGTNALLRIPPDAFPSRFGSGSLNLHRLEAKLAGVEVKVLENHRISLDIDTPQDVLKFMEVESKTTTLDVMQNLHAMERLACIDKADNAST